MCEHERLRTVGDRVFCCACGEELPLAFLLAKSKPAATAAPAEPEAPAAEEKPKKKTRKAKGGNRMIRALVEQTFDSQKKYFVLAGTSEDDKPVSGLITGSEFHEVDTGLTYQFDEVGASWHVVGLTPADIQSEIDAWLDEHPEATTTVEDGAISYAKLNSSLQETVDDVGDLKSAIGYANNGDEVIKGTFVHGSVNTSTGVMTESANNYKYRVVTPSYILYDRDVTIRCTSGFQFQAYWYDNTDTLVGKMGSSGKSYQIKANTRFRLYVNLDPIDTSANVDPSVFQNNIYVESVVGYQIIELGNGMDVVNNKISASNKGAELLETTLEHGRILTTSGHVGEVSVSANNYKYFAVTPNAVSFSTPKKIKANTGYSVQVWWYDNNDAYVGRSANFVSEYSLNANTKYRFFMSNDPLDTSANIDVETFSNNVYLISALGERVEAIESNPLTTLPDYMLNNMAEKPLGSLSKGYILLSFDDGAKTLATGTIPLLIENEVPGTFGLLPQSEIFAEGNESELATVVDAVENHGCAVAMHGSEQWTTYTESALNAYFDSTIALFIDNDLGDTYGAICPGGNGDDTSALVKAVSGGKFGYVFSGNRADKISYDAANADGKYNGARSNRFDLDRRSGIGITTTKVQDIVNYAAENHLLLCPFWHDNTLNDENHLEYITYFNALISAAKDAGLTFITTKDLPNIT